VRYTYVLAAISSTFYKYCFINIIKAINKLDDNKLFKKKLKAHLKHFQTAEFVKCEKFNKSFTNEKFNLEFSFQTLYRQLNVYIIVCFLSAMRRSKKEMKTLKSPVLLTSFVIKLAVSGTLCKNLFCFKDFI